MWKILARTLISKPLPIDAPAPDEAHLAELAGRLDRSERELLESFALGDLVRHVGQLSRAQAIAFCVLFIGVFALAK